MKVVRFSVARENLEAVLDRLTDDVDYTVISRENDKHAVVISLDEFNSMMEIANSLENPATAAPSGDDIPYAEFPDTGKVYRLMHNQKETPVEVVQFPDFRENLDAVLERVADEAEYLLIPRRNDKHAVVMSSDEFNGLMETAYLLGSPANAAHLRSSLAQYRAGKCRVAA